jgi:hypothetical protein
VNPNGGAIYSDHATLTLIGVTLSGSQTFFGGRIYNDCLNWIDSGVVAETFVLSELTGSDNNLLGQEALCGSLAKTEENFLRSGFAQKNIGDSIVPRASRPDAYRRS